MMEFTEGKIVHKDELNNIARQQKFGVISGCETTADSPASLDVIVSAGDYLINGVKYSTLGDTITITPDATYNSSASIFLDTSGVVSVEYGALSLNDDTTGKPLPTYDYDADTHLPIARIFVGGGVSAISQSNIKSLRIENFDTSELNEKIYDDVILLNLEATTSSAALDLSSIANKYSITIKNIGYINCFISFTNTATTSDYMIPFGSELFLNNCSFDDISAITSANSTTLSISIGVKQSSGERQNFEILNINATDTTSAISFANTTEMKSISIVNVGVGDCYINFGNTAATTNYKLQVEDLFVTTTTKYTIASICDTGDTTTIRILGVW